MRRVSSMPTLDADDARCDASETSTGTGRGGDARAETTAGTSAAARGDAEAEAEAAAEAETEGDRAPTVLVVDDCAMNRNLVRGVLMSVFSRVRVETAKDGREGIQRFEALARDGDVALVVMDYNMPWCDGVTAAKYVRALEDRMIRLALERDASPRPRVPIVMYTTELHVILPALVDGVIDDRLPKVCSRDLFSRVMLRHLAPRHTRFVKPEWRGIDERMMRFSCNDAFNVELDPRGVSLADDSLANALTTQSGKKRVRGRLNALTNSSRWSKMFKGVDGDVIILQDRSMEASGAESRTSRGFVKRLTRSFTAFFTSAPTARAKMKEVKRAALAKKFNADFDNSNSSAHGETMRAPTYSQLANVTLPRYSY